MFLELRKKLHKIAVNYPFVTSTKEETTSYWQLRQKKSQLGNLLENTWDQAYVEGEKNPKTNSLSCL